MSKGQLKPLVVALLAALLALGGLLDLLEALRIYRQGEEQMVAILRELLPARQDQSQPGLRGARPSA